MLRDRALHEGFLGLRKVELVATRTGRLGPERSVPDDSVTFFRGCSVEALRTHSHDPLLADMARDTPDPEAARRLRRCLVPGIGLGDVAPAAERHGLDGIGREEHRIVPRPVMERPAPLGGNVSVAVLTLPVSPRRDLREPLPRWPWIPPARARLVHGAGAGPGERRPHTPRPAAKRPAAAESASEAPPSDAPRRTNRFTRGARGPAPLAPGSVRRGSSARRRGGTRWCCPARRRPSAS